MCVLQYDVFLTTVRATLDYTDSLSAALGYSFIVFFFLLNNARL